MDWRAIFLLMLPAFCECLVLVGIHSYLGIHVIKRKVIFVDLAFAQIAALGTLIAFLFGIPPHTPAAFGFALFLTAIGAAVFSLCRFRGSRIPQEAVIGLVYAIAAATAILLIDSAPHGAEHLKEILTGSILWVKWGSILTAAVVYLAVGFFHYVFRRKFFLISEDPDAAAEAGLRVRLWDFLFYLSFGLVITLSVDVAGVLIVFVFLVAPAILAMLITDRLAIQLIIGWILGVVVTSVGLVVAYVEDLSTGPAVIATYGVVMVLVAATVYLLRAPRKEVALRNAALVTGGFAVAIGALCLAGERLGKAYEGQDVHAHCGDASASGPEVSVDVPGDRVEALLGLLDAEPAVGAARALDLLRTPPPPFFRERIITKLREAMGEDPGFVEAEEPDSPANLRAAERVRLHFGLE